MLHTGCLYPHLSQYILNEAKEFEKSFSHNIVSSTDKNYIKNLNDEADSLLPVLSTGHRMNDIDALSSLTNPVARDLLISRMQRIGIDYNINDGLSDEEIASQVISKDMTSSDVQEQIYQLNEFIDSNKVQQQIEPVEPIIPPSPEKVDTAL